MLHDDETTTPQDAQRREARVGAYMQRAPQIGQRTGSRLGAGGIGLDLAADLAAGGAQSGRRPVIEAALSEHLLSIEQLWQWFQELEARLAPVLAPVFPSDQAKVSVGQPEPILPPLAGRLSGMTTDLHKVASKVRELIDRLEV